MRTFLAIVLVACVGCGSGGKGSITVGGATLRVQDSLYKTAPAGRFCQGLALDQVQLFFDDYTPDCYIDVKAGDMPRDPSADHYRLSIVLAFGGNPTATAPPYTPFALDSTATCDIGGSDVVADFLHFAAGVDEKSPPTNDTKADHGTVTITRYDRMNKQAMTGNFDLFFGGDEVKGTINALNCD